VKISRKPWVAMLGLASISLFAQPQPGQAGLKEMVRDEMMTKTGVSETRADQELWDMSAVPDQVHADSVQLVGQDWDALQNRARLRFRCLPRNACAPFAVAREMSIHDFESLGHANLRTSVNREPNLFAKPGDVLTLVVANGGVRVTAVVTCLERAKEGQSIRVRRSDGRVLRGRLVAAGLVEIGGQP